MPESAGAISFARQTELNAPLYRFGPGSPPSMNDLLVNGALDTNVLAGYVLSDAPGSTSGFAQAVYQAPYQRRPVPVTDSFRAQNVQTFVGGRQYLQAAVISSRGHDPGPTGNLGVGNACAKLDVDRSEAVC